LRNRNVITAHGVRLHRSVTLTTHMTDFLNTFGENVMVEEIERALLEACRRGHAEIVGFTVAPSYSSPEQPQGAHEWLIEFAEPPRAPATFVRALDETLQRLNANYRAKRAGDGAMVAPRVLEVPPGTFYRWLRAGGTGDHRTVPRVTDDRSVADAILSTVTAQGREPLIAVGI
jgi:hypothetical protein